MRGIGFFYWDRQHNTLVEVFRRRRRLGYNANKRKNMATVLVRAAIDRKYTPFHLSIRQSKVHQRGVYAGEFIPARRKVIEYTGERINRKEAKRRGEGPLTYLFSLDDYWTIDGAVGGSGAEIINHSCDPNLRSSIHRGHILYWSKRDIRTGEELTIDYLFSKKIDRIPCYCGAANCRGTINVK